MAWQPLVSQGFIIVEASRLHSDTPQSVGLLWTSDRPVAETFTWQNTTLTTDRFPCSPPHPAGIRTRSPSKRAALDRTATGIGRIDCTTVNVLEHILFFVQSPRNERTYHKSRVCPSVRISWKLPNRFLFNLILLFTAYFPFLWRCNQRLWRFPRAVHQ